MKKSTNESSRPSEPEITEPTYQAPLLWEMFIMEGGISLLIIFPLVVLFFLRMAYESV
jgi:hypothetical protein